MSQKHRGGIAKAQYYAQLKSMQKEDPYVEDIILSCSHAALYVLENNTSVHWKKVGIEGFFYLIKRSAFPKYILAIRNQTDSGEGDFAQSIDGSMRFEVKEGTFFYQIGNEGHVRGIWFHDKDFMMKFATEIHRICQELGYECDGTFGPVANDASGGPISQESGKAILQLLKKESSHRSEPLHAQSNTHTSEVVRPNAVELLRKEMSTNAIGYTNGNSGGVITHESSNSYSAPVPVQPSVMLHYPYQPSIPYNGLHMTTQTIRGPSCDLNNVTAADLREVLMDMIGSDAFIGELFARLSSRSRR